jgi:hypothetical protein
MSSAETLPPRTIDLHGKRVRVIAIERGDDRVAVLDIGFTDLDVYAVVEMSAPMVGRTIGWISREEFDRLCQRTPDGRRRYVLVSQLNDPESLVTRH